MKMKINFLAVSLLFSINAMASVDLLTFQNEVVSEAEINASRACFSEVESFGCRSPHEDLPEFRSCMSDHYLTLSTDCRKFFQELYGSKN
jgi:hypothetical protein